METIQLLILIVLAVYGFMFGVRNTVVRIICISNSNKTMTQGGLGLFFDALWYVGITYFLIRHFS